MSNAAPGLSPGSASRNRGSVLVVEDDDPTRHRVATLLQSAGYDVTEAVDGLDALQRISASRFDAIVLDLVLPHVDGWQFRATQLRHPELAGIPTVILTIQPLREPDRYALRAADVVHKPFDDAALLRAIERACRTPRAQIPAPGAAPGGLFWSRHGEIACAGHAPDPTSARWTDERWAPIPVGAGKDRVAYQCQHCDQGGRSIARRSRTNGDERLRT